MMMKHGSLRFKGGLAYTDDPDLAAECKAHPMLRTVERESREVRGFKVFTVPALLWKEK